MFSNAVRVAVTRRGLASAAKGDPVQELFVKKLKELTGKKGKNDGVTRVAQALKKKQGTK
eukprot:m.110037 g.110037  ORF g.110037 m.110037 type:complete len:60 (-) comp16013_c2_seq1:132-311(-)